jgi:membrane fusion protein, multidrug efflux system
MPWAGIWKRCTVNDMEGKENTLDLGQDEKNGNSTGRTIRKWLFRTVVLVLLIIGIIYGIKKVSHSFSHESTDNAYVAGVIVPVAPEIRGRVTRVYINDNQYVKAGTRLLEIFPDDYADAVKERRETVSALSAEAAELRAAVAQRTKGLAQAEANLKAAVADEALADKELKRYGRLVEQDAVPRSQYDYAESRSMVAKAREEAAESAVVEAQVSIEAAQARLNTQGIRVSQAQTTQRLAQLNFQRTVITAPCAGRIARKNVDEGKYIQPGQALLAVVRNDTWIIANFKETQIGRMTVGQPVDVSVDAYPGKVFKGRIDSVQAGTGSVFSLLPPENATGNFVKVVQRVPVKVVIDTPFDESHPLLPGLSVVPTVDVSRETGVRLSSR